MPKEKSTTELRDEKNQLIQRGKEILSGAKTEKRQLSEAENKELSDNQIRMAEIDLDIAASELTNGKRGVPHTPVSGEKFSLRRAILAQMNKTEQRESEASVIEAATLLHRSVAATAENCGELIIPLEMRAPYTAGAEAQKGVVIDEDQMELLLPLEPNLVLAQAGVRMLTGLVGNIYWPKHSAVTVTWEGENAEAKDGSGAFDKGTLFSPKRLTAFVDISKQLLIQENRSVESLIRQLIAVALAQKIEQTAFSAAAHVDNVPDGLFQSGVTSLGAMSWPNVVKMETDADLQNALFGNLAYILNPSLVGAAKTKVKDASGAGGFIFGNEGVGMLNGYRALRSNNIPNNLGDDTDELGILFGNWAHYFLGQWGAVDMTVDPFTQATKGMVRLVVNSYWNMGKIRDESFSVGSMG